MESGSSTIRKGGKKVVKKKNEEMRISLKVMEQSLQCYRTTFGLLQNYSRPMWASLVHDRERFEEMKASLEKDAEVFSNIVASLADLEAKRKPVKKIKPLMPPIP